MEFGVGFLLLIVKLLLTGLFLQAQSLDQIKAALCLLFIKGSDFVDGLSETERQLDRLLSWTSGRGVTNLLSIVHSCLEAELLALLFELCLPLQDRL